MTYAHAKFEVAVSSSLGDAFTGKYFLTFDLKVTQNIAQYPLHYVIYAPAKLEVATSNGVGKMRTQLWYEINISTVLPFF